MRVVVWDRAGRPDLMELVRLTLGQAYHVVLAADAEAVRGAVEGARALVVTDGTADPLFAQIKGRVPLPAVVLVTVGLDLPPPPPPAAVTATVDAGRVGVALLRVVVAATIRDLLLRSLRSVASRRGLHEKLRDGLALALSLEHRPIKTLSRMGNEVGCSPSTLSRAWRRAGVSRETRGVFLRAAVLLRALILWLERSELSWIEIADAAGASLRALESYTHEWFDAPPSALEPAAVPSAVAEMELHAFGWLLATDVGRAGSTR
jgi:AraC-like DNA-binding protein